MSAEGRFLVFCIEMYRTARNLTGKQVFELFNQYDVIDYILSCYDVLHTFGHQYIVEDIDEFIKARQTT